MKNVLATSAVGVVCIALAMTFSLTSCQHGDNPIDSLVSKSILGGKNSNIGGVASVRGQDLSPEERKRRIEAFVSRPEIKQTSQGLEELAKLVAIAVEDESLRHRIYECCQEKFDGESNVLWQQLDVDESVRASGGNFSEKIDAIRSRRNIGSVVRNIGSVKSAVTQFEKHFDAPLHLFWMYPSQWDKKTVPFIAFVPRDVDPGTLKSIPAFDANGNRYTLEANGDLAKKHPVIVIAFNERTTIDGRKKLGLLMVNSDSEINDNRKPPKGTASVASLNGLKIQTINLFYPYNQDEIAEWDGAPEFQWDCFFWSQYTHDGGDAPFGSATFPALSGFFGGGGISANAAYLGSSSIKRGA